MRSVHAVVLGVVLGAAVGVGGAVDAARASAPPYGLVGSFAGAGATWDIAPDGRIYAISGNAVMRQNTVNSSAFTEVATIPAGLVNSFGPSFLRFSPDGSKVALGDGNFSASAAVKILDAGPLNITGPSTSAVSVIQSIATPNYDGTWDGSSRLYVTGGRSTDFVNIVNRVDLPGGTANTVISGVGGASGGIALRAGRLYTASGYVPTGETRWFTLASLSTVTPSAFSSGSLVGSFLSGSPLDFDPLGDLLVGGGDTFSGTSDTGYAAVIDLTDIAHPLHLAPNGAATSYAARFNAATNELLVWDETTFGYSRYAVPAPGGVALLGLAGVAAARRRRHA